MAKSPSPTVRKRRLGAELRRLREIAGITLADAGTRLGVSESTVSRLEHGYGRLGPSEVGDMLDLYSVQDPDIRDVLVQLSREVRRKGWWKEYDSVVSAPYADYISLETDAASMRSFVIQYIPGLLQTETYLRAIAEAWLVTSPGDDVEKLVNVRKERQKVLAKENPLDLCVIIHETALLVPVGGAKVMREQLQHLLDMQAAPNVTIRVLPLHVGAHPSMDEPFAIFGFDLDPDVVYIGALRSALYIEEPEETAPYARVYDHLKAMALSAQDSATLIMSAVEQT